jgi:hypothetical protein
LAALWPTLRYRARAAAIAAVELRWSLGQKRVEAFLRICAARRRRDRFVLEFHLLVEAIGDRAVKQMFHRSVGTRGAVGQFISQRFRLRDQLIIWHYPRDQTNRFRFARR